MGKEIKEGEIIKAMDYEMPDLGTIYYCKPIEKIGQEIDFYGPVSPYIGKIAQIEKEVEQKFPRFYEYFVNNSDHSSFNSFKN